MVKFLDLEKVNNRFRSEIDEKIKQILDKGWYLSGEENDKFCKNFADFCGTKYALGVANGLDALNLIIKAYGFCTGDEIIVPANTYIATILAVTQNGCTPVLVEPDINTYNINPDLIEEKEGSFKNLNIEDSVNPVKYLYHNTRVKLKNKRAIRKMGLESPQI